MFNLDRTGKILLTLLVLGVWGSLFRSSPLPPPLLAQTKTATRLIDDSAQVIRARGLILVDERGRDCIFIGSPVPHPQEGRRLVGAATGMVIDDEAGNERFGLGLQKDGTLMMGFDAPPEVGDDRNRERIHIAADSKGGAAIRFLNRKTLVPGWMRVGEDDRLYLDFLDVQKEKKKIIRRRAGIKGEEILEGSLQ